MTTLTLSIDKETKKFERDDGPVAVHAGETVLIVLKGLGITATTANGVNLIENSGAEGADDPNADLASAYPYLRIRLVHPVFGDLAMYPWPESSCQWTELDSNHPGEGLQCQLDLDTEQLFRVVRTGRGGELTLYVETPWPESVPTVYGTYPLLVEDWPEATGEIRVFPSTGKYANAFADILSLNAVNPDTGDTLRKTMTLANALLAAMKKLAKRDGEPEEEEAEE